MGHSRDGRLGYGISNKSQQSINQFNYSNRIDILKDSIKKSNDSFKLKKKTPKEKNLLKRIKKETILTPEALYKLHPYSHPKYSPLKIPKKAIITIKAKKDFKQIKYVYHRGIFKYVVRWHTKTKNQPDSAQAWVVTRYKQGKGSGKNARAREIHHLSGKKWVSHEEWKRAINARKNHTATKQQIKMLNDAHFTRKRRKK